MIPQTIGEPQLLTSQPADNKSATKKVGRRSSALRLLSFGEDDEDSLSPVAEDKDERYTRNVAAMDDPQDMRKYILPESRLGLNIVKSLQEASESKQKKTNDITGKRRERKSVLPVDAWLNIEEQLRDAGVELVNREKAGAAEGRTRATLTYYGTTATFYNHQVQTKIRMRIRYYLSYVRTADGMIADVQREGATKDKGFLELKVKGPRANEENSVDKYRLLVSDAVVARLVNLDATQPTFLNDLELVKQAVQTENDEKNASLISTMFETIGMLSRRKPSFIRPSLVISYERSAFKYVEHDYPIPVAGSAAQEIESSKKSNKTRRRINKSALPWQRRSRQATSTSGRDGLFLDGDDTTVDTSSSKNGTELHDIEYQFTVDRNVRAHYPLLPVEGATNMPVAEHFNVNNVTELMRYPAEARVVEFKEPLAVATLPEKQRSADHNSLIRILVDRMEAEIMWGEYDENVGKYGNFRRRLVEEHHADRIKNELIQIDFSGRGQYQQHIGMETPAGDIGMETPAGDFHMSGGYYSSATETDNDSVSSVEC